MVVSVPHFQWDIGERREGKEVLEVKRSDATEPEMEQIKGREILHVVALVGWGQVVVLSRPRLEGHSGRRVTPTMGQNKDINGNTGRRELPKAFDDAATSALENQ
ncbi:hypothetical protein VNO77_01542 [Canavalia gladiata]|uniref:Uncharacterized protein n=1 Tax=Canavalia gladiata TaxID=3824 RepID=A0AAN9MS25_CANGL